MFCMCCEEGNKLTVIKHATNKITHITYEKEKLSKAKAHWNEKWGKSWDFLSMILFMYITAATTTLKVYFFHKMINHETLELYVCVCVCLYERITLNKVL